MESGFDWFMVITSTTGTLAIIAFVGLAIFYGVKAMLDYVAKRTAYYQKNKKRDN